MGNVIPFEPSKRKGLSEIEHVDSTTIVEKMVME